MLLGARYRLILSFAFGTQPSPGTRASHRDGERVSLSWQKPQMNFQCTFKHCLALLEQVNKITDHRSLHFIKSTYPIYLIYIFYKMKYDLI